MPINLTLVLYYPIRHSCPIFPINPFKRSPTGSSEFLNLSFTCWITWGRWRMLLIKRGSGTQLNLISWMGFSIYKLRREGVDINWHLWRIGALCNGKYLSHSSVLAIWHRFTLRPVNWYIRKTPVLGVNWNWAVEQALRRFNQIDNWHIIANISYFFDNQFNIHRYAGC